LVYLAELYSASLGLETCSRVDNELVHITVMMQLTFVTLALLYGNELETVN